MLRVVTFNAGLAVGVLPHTAERVPYVVEAIAALDADVVFVQEFWLDAHWQRLREACASKWPHTFRPEPLHAVERGACSAEEIAPLVACAREHCAGLRDDALARCVVSHCASHAMHLSPACVNCIAHHPVGALDEILAPCVGGGVSVGRSARDARRGRAPEGLVAYGGSFGTGILSRIPLAARDFLAFVSTVNARGALHARLDVDDLAPMHLFATHLSPFGGEEKRAQVDALLAWIDEKAKRAPAILTGDLNLDPSDALFARLLGAGFHDVFADDGPGTYAYGGLANGGVSESGWRIDHVLVRGDFVLSAERVLDTPRTLEVDGRALATTLSDHFGVRATIARATRSRVR